VECNLINEKNSIQLNNKSQFLQREREKRLNKTKKKERKKEGRKEEGRTRREKERERERAVQHKEERKETKRSQQGNKLLDMAETMEGCVVPPSSLSLESKDGGMNPESVDLDPSMLNIETKVNEQEIVTRMQRLLAMDEPDELQKQTKTTPKIEQVKQYLNRKMRITIADNRMLTGKFYGFDKNKNIILSDCVEFHKEYRTLGLVLVAWKHIVKCEIEEPTPIQETTTNDQT
jgi:small nuclear ribonucleoprotein (snRNP)-like protein